MTLTHARLTQLFHYDPDTGLFSWKISTAICVKVGGIAGSETERGYVRIMIGNKHYKAHRLAWFYVTGEWPSDQIDHINGNRSDNRFANLREASHAENVRNRGLQVNNTSGFKGVHFLKCTGRWRSYITVNSKKKHLGYFDTAEEAHAAYCKAAEKYHGEFANTL